MRSLKEQAKQVLASHPLCPSISGKGELMQNNRPLAWIIFNCLWIGAGTDVRRFPRWVKCPCGFNKKLAHYNKDCSSGAPLLVNDCGQSQVEMTYLICCFRSVVGRSRLQFLSRDALGSAGRKYHCWPNETFLRKQVGFQQLERCKLFEFAAATSHDWD